MASARAYNHHTHVAEPPNRGFHPVLEVAFPYIFIDAFYGLGLRTMLPAHNRTNQICGGCLDHEHDPWGEPGYRPVTVQYDRYVTTDTRSRDRFLDGLSSYPEVVGPASALRERGFAESDVASLLGENFLRVAAEVWKRDESQP